MNTDNLKSALLHMSHLAMTIGRDRKTVQIDGAEFDIDLQNFAPKWSQLPERKQNYISEFSKFFIFSNETDARELIAITAHYAKAAYNFARERSSIIIGWQETDDLYRKMTLKLAEMSFNSNEEEMYESVKGNEKPWKDADPEMRMIFTIFRNAVIEASIALTGERRWPAEEDRRTEEDLASEDRTSEHRPPSEDRHGE